MVIPSGRIAVLGLDKKLQVLSTTSFDITCPPLYVEDAYSQTNVTSAITRTTNYNTLDTAFNLTSTYSIQGATANSNVYIVGNLVEKIFTPTTDVLTCIEPTTEDGLYYMLLGRMTSTTNAVLQAEHPIYVFKNGNFQRLEATTATSYITQIDNTGIKITPYDKSGNDYLQLNSDAISMYRNNIETLRIEDSAIRIGKTKEAHFLLTSSRLTGYGNNNNIYFDAGKGDNANVRMFYGVYGDETSFEIGPVVKNIEYVKKEGNLLTEGTDYEIHTTSTFYDILFNTNPFLNSTITVNYRSLYHSDTYSVGSSSTTNVVINGTNVIIKPKKSYQAANIKIKKSGADHWQVLNNGYTVNQEIIGVKLSAIPQQGAKIYIHDRVTFGSDTVYLLGTSTGQSGVGGDIFYFSSATATSLSPLGPGTYVYKIYSGTTTMLDYTEYKDYYTYTIIDAASSVDQVKLQYLIS
jgi:hypothetical protein